MPGIYCRKCGGEMRRIHRTFREKFLYYGVLECTVCHERVAGVREYRYLLGPSARCHKCGTYRITRLQRPDHIDPMYRDLLSLTQRLFPDKRIYHCRFCRIQFWDRRPLQEEVQNSATVGTATQGV